MSNAPTAPDADSSPAMRTKSPENIVGFFLFPLGLCSARLAACCSNQALGAAIHPR